MKKQLFYLLLCALFLGASCKKECNCDNQEPPACTVDLAKGLLAYYPFNGNSNDQSGNGLNATATNGAALTTDYLGRANMAAGFDGVNDYYIVPGNEKLNSDEVTFSFQVMVNNNNRRNAIISRVKFDNQSSLVYNLHESLPTDNKWSSNAFPSTTACSVAEVYNPSHALYTNGPITPGRWYSVIVTFGGNGDFKIYIDGVLNATKNYGFNKLKRCADADLVIGGWWKNDIVSLDGKLDEMRIYNRVLTDCEIAKLAEVFKQ